MFSNPQPFTRFAGDSPMKSNPFFLLPFVSAAVVFSADVTITVNADSGRIPISPYLYGRNNSLSDDPEDPTPSADLKLYREAGLWILRENGGNNATKYNWHKKLTSHPDWYNNVYAHDWDFIARTIQDSLPGAQGFLALQLIGWAAANTQHNFNDWDYNGSAWWGGCAQNLAGGGTVNPDGSDSALADGDPSLYLEPWPADSTAGILDHWFGSGGVGLDKERFLYWNMDNEPEIWSGTHDDVVKTISAEEFMQKYFAVAKSARARFPGIRLAGFVACNEWQWYAWNNSQVSVTENGKTVKYVWAEYFIKRIAEEQKTTGIRLLDVMDFHFYPQTDDDAALTLQLHRVWFDTAWNYPKANGCKLIGGGWDEKSTKEYIMERCSRWLNKYMGEGHGVRFGVSEYGTFYADDPNVTAAWYASQIGTFADHGVELFTPWEWQTGMWEVLHLYSRYAGALRVKSTSTLDTLVSAYSSLGTGGSDLTVILVNRDADAARTVDLQLAGFTASAPSCSTYTLSSLPDEETFNSHTNNALAAGTAPVNGSNVALSLPALSVTALKLSGKADLAIKNPTAVIVAESYETYLRGTNLFLAFPGRKKNITVTVYAANGSRVLRRSFTNSTTADISLSLLPSGRYIVDAGSDLPKRAVVVIR